MPGCLDPTVPVGGELVFEVGRRLLSSEDVDEAFAPLARCGEQGCGGVEVGES